MCPYLAMSETSPPMLSSVVVFTGRHKPSGAFTKPCISARQTPSVTVNGSAVCPQVKNKEFPQTNEAGRKRGGGEPSYAAKGRGEEDRTKIGVGRIGACHQRDSCAVEKASILGKVPSNSACCCGWPATTLSGHRNLDSCVRLYR